MAHKFNISTVSVEIRARTPEAESRAAEHRSAAADP